MRESLTPAAHSYNPTEVPSLDLAGWPRGLYRDIAWDVTVVHPGWPVATEPRHALTVAFNRKAGSVAEACRRQDIAFVPLAAVSLDGWHEVAVAQLDRLAAALSRYTGQPEEEASGGGGHLFGRLSVLLMRGNAALFSNRIPDHINPQDKRQIVDHFCDH